MKKKSIYLLIMLALVCMIAVPAYAEQGQLESVIIDVNGVLVEVDITSFAIAMATGPSDPLYNFLKGDGDAPVIFGVKSGGKYMNITDFALSYATSGNNISDAINNAPALPGGQVSSIQIFTGFDEQGQPVLNPIVTEVTAEALNVIIDTVLPGVINITIPFADAQAKLGATTDVLLVLAVEGKDSLELTYNAAMLDGAGGFFIAAVQGYTDAEIKAAVVGVKEPPPVVKAQDLNAVIDTILPGIFNVTIPLVDAQAKLDATIGSTLLLAVEGKDSLELTYSDKVLDGAGGFFKAAIQGYSKAEINSGVVTIK